MQGPTAGRSDLRQSDSGTDTTQQHTAPALAAQAGKPSVAEVSCDFQSACSSSPDLSDGELPSSAAPHSIGGNPAARAFAYLRLSLILLRT